MQILPHLEESDLQSIEALNRRLWAYIEGEYHHSPHRGLDGQTPLDRWAQSGSRVRLLPREIDLDSHFLDEAKRRVHKDRTTRLGGRGLEVDAVLIARDLIHPCALPPQGDDDISLLISDSLGLPPLAAGPETRRRARLAIP